MKRIISVLLIIILVLMITVGCGRVNESDVNSDDAASGQTKSEDGNNGSVAQAEPSAGEDSSTPIESSEEDDDADVSTDTATQHVTAVLQYLYFEDYLETVTDLVEGRFVSSTQEGALIYCIFEAVNDLRGNGLNGTVTVRYKPADCTFADANGEFSTYDAKFIAGTTYLLPLIRATSVYIDGYSYYFSADSLIIPVQDYEQSAELYGTPLRGHIKTQEAMEAFDNGELAGYILETIRDNPRVFGTPYTESTDIAEIVGFSDHVLKVTVGVKIQDGDSGDRTTYKCRIDEVLKGDIGPDLEPWVVFPAGKAEQGGTYIVAVCEVDSPTFLVMSSKNSVFDCSEYDTLKEIINKE